MEKWTLSKNGFDFLSKEEGLRLVAYQDTGGVWTIGLGHTKGVKLGDIITLDQAYGLFNEDASWINAFLNELKIESLNQNRYDACFDYCFNAGTPRFKDLIFPAIQKGWNIKNLGIPMMIIIHDKTGRTLDNLVNRRMKELIMMLS